MNYICDEFNKNWEFMKKAILFSLIFILSIGFAKAQTTIEEYNYITKEYKSYLPIKEGYKLEDINTVIYSLNSVDRIFNFKKFIREETNEVAAILVEYVRVSKGRTYILYFCIPSENSSDGVWKIVQDTIEAFGTTEVRNAYIWALNKYISKTF
ncbi:conserved hypothetical protein [uncultured Paludibacter sp.]|uniref:Uncharacterized protein n=1 Tax=uncultured Paludibacter sp. TaxID=497635 RepID=A0A653AFW9_9BACT|nr:conserved hypothetical protein [uncultured Paludibacter sp.]